MDLTGKTVLVTGAAKRIGRAVALALAARGAHIFIHYHGSEAGARTLKHEVRELGVNAWSATADLRREAETTVLFDRAIKAAGRIDILINNASIFPEDTLQTITESSWSDNMLINAYAPLVLSRALAGQGRAGVIINFLDAAMDEHNPQRWSYTLSKQLLQSITRSLALELAPQVRVNGVAPGLILPPEGKADDYLEKLAFTNPLQTHGSLEELCAAVNFLIDTPFVTGQVIYVDGGRHLRGFGYAEQTF